MTRTLLLPLALLVGLTAANTVLVISVGPPPGDWQDTPEPISIIADKLDLGLPVTDEERAEFDAYTATLPK